jgi:hypothetical protein
MIPESKWFRPPKFYELAPNGDHQRFLWVAEPVAHAGIYGVSYHVPHTYLCRMAYSPLALLAIHADARKELNRRVRTGEFTLAEGAPFETFEWTPPALKETERC